MKNFRNKQGVINVSPNKYPQKCNNNNWNKQREKELPVPVIEQKSRNQKINYTIGEKNKDRQMNQKVDQEKEVRKILLITENERPNQYKKCPKHQMHDWALVKELI